MALAGLYVSRKEHKMPDPITIAMITAAVSVLGNEYLKGIASEAGKNTWQKVKSLFGWESEPEVSDVASQVARKLHASPELVQQVWELLKSNKDAGTASAMVGKIEAEKVVVSQIIVTKKIIM
jgi:hypothetical protein